MGFLLGLFTSNIWKYLFGFLIFMGVLIFFALVAGVNISYYYSDNDRIWGRIDRQGLNDGGRPPLMRPRYAPQKESD